MRASVAQLTWSGLPEISISLRGEPLSLDQTLACGQAFRWRLKPDETCNRPQNDGDGDVRPARLYAGGPAATTLLDVAPPRDDAAPVETCGAHVSVPPRTAQTAPFSNQSPQWEGVAGGHVWRLRQEEDCLLARVAPIMPADDVARFLREYFALDLSAHQIQEAIVDADPRAAPAVRQFEGLRILRQDPLETVLTFAIATATNVPRVTRSVGELCRRFGSPIAVVDGIAYHDFPTLEQVLAAPEDVLFGPCNLAYRARSIQAIARALLERPPDWLDTLRAGPYPDAHRALDELPFYGPKVSDCACLFGLGFDEAVPVDVHVWAIAHELFGAAIPTRTLTPRTYQKIGDLFRATFGDWAGWAQQYLFCARRAVPVRERFRPTKC